MALTTDPGLFLTWQYSDEEWEDYVRIERKNKKEDNIFFGIGVFIIGTIGLVLLRSTTILVGMSFALFFALLMPYLRMRFSYPHLKSASSPTVEFYRDRIIANGKKIVLENDRDIKKRWLKHLKFIHTDEGVLLLEFDVHWITGKGPTSDEFRFMVLPDKINDAKQLMKQYGFNSFNSGI